MKLCVEHLGFTFLAHPVYDREWRPSENQGFLVVDLREISLV